jgi:hypothetical protein
MGAAIQFVELDDNAGAVNAENDATVFILATSIGF